MARGLFDSILDCILNRLLAYIRASGCPIGSAGIKVRVVGSAPDSPSCAIASHIFIDFVQPLH